MLDLEFQAKLLGMTEGEIRAEMAASLGRTAVALERLVAEIARAEGEARALEGDARGRAVDRYNHLRARAEYYRWCLTVQREAIGLRDSRELNRTYPIPPRLPR